MPGRTGRDWSWVYGLTESQLRETVEGGNWHIIDLEPYAAIGSARYAAILVKNSGEAEKEWWWKTGQTPTQIRQLEEVNGARAVDIDLMPAVRGSTPTRSVVLIAKSGPDQIASTLLLRHSRTRALETLRRQRLRPIEIEPSRANYDVIAIPAGNTRWSWSLKTPGEMASGPAPAERFYDLDFVATNDSYSVLSVNPPQTVGDPSESRRILDLLEYYFPGADYEFYVKRIGGVRSPAQWIDHGTPCSPG